MNILLQRYGSFCEKKPVTSRMLPVKAEDRLLRTVLYKLLYWINNMLSTFIWKRLYEYYWLPKVTGGGNHVPTWWHVICPMSSIASCVCPWCVPIVGVSLLRYVLTLTIEWSRSNPRYERDSSSNQYFYSSHFYEQRVSFHYDLA